MSASLIAIYLALVTLLVYFLYLSYPQTLIRLRVRKKDMDELAVKYGLKNLAKTPTLGDWLARRRVDINTIEGKINNHQVKVIDTGYFGLNLIKWYWRGATFIEVDGKIINESYKSWRQKIGGGLSSYLLPVKKIEEVLNKEA